MIPRNKGTAVVQGTQGSVSVSENGFTVEPLGEEFV